MPKLFEIFGYPVEDNSKEAQQNRIQARCPFMDRDCDGGGNRYLSQIDLSKNSQLKVLYPNRNVLAAGVCSIQPTTDSVPWIVCPRRLLVMGREEAGIRVHQKFTEDTVVNYAGYKKGTKLGIWSEVKMKQRSNVGETKVNIDYTFDYILMPLGSVSQYELEELLRIPWARLYKLFESGGYTIAVRNGEYFVEDCPIGYPSVIEIMTSSTSGGNKKKRTNIPMAFEDAILGKPHSAPGINYRQVWARMASQLIAKSEIALEWGGKTIWVVQDVLVDYVSENTALNVHQFLSKKTHEVNLLSFSYGNSYKSRRGILDLSEQKLYSGPMSSSTSDEPSFQDITRASTCPPLSFLIKLLAARSPMNQIIVG